MSADRQTGASIRGERIATQARKYIPKTDRFVDGKRRIRMTLAKNAYCVVEIPLRYGSGAGAGVRAGAAIHGERIDCEADAVSRIGKTMGSSTHNIQLCRLIGDAVCTLALPLIGLSKPQS